MTFIRSDILKLSAALFLALALLLPGLPLAQQAGKVEVHWLGQATFKITSPGGNITGLFLDLPGLTGKWLQLVTEVVPATRRVAALWDPTTGPHQLRALKVATQAAAIDLQVLRRPLEHGERSVVDGDHVKGPIAKGDAVRRIQASRDDDGALAMPK